MALSGTYVFVKDEGFADFLRKQDVDEKVIQARKSDSSLEIAVNGNNITLTNTFADGKVRKLEFEIGKEFEEKMGPYTHKGVATLEGNILTIASKSLEGTPLTKTYIPSATGLEVVHKTSKGEGKIIFKRQ